MKLYLPQGKPRESSGWSRGQEEVSIHVRELAEGPGYKTGWFTSDKESSIHLEIATNLTVRSVCKLYRLFTTIDSFIDHFT